MNANDLWMRSIVIGVARGRLLVEIPSNSLAQNKYVILDKTSL